MNPISRQAAGFAPWWVLLETTGRKTGRKRLTPFASGPFDGKTAYVIAVYGEHTAFAHNIAANRSVRLKRRGKWHSGAATLIDLDDDIVRRFGPYGRYGLARIGDDAKLLRIDLD